MKVVRPEWLVQSAQVGALLPWRDFIYKPEEMMEASWGPANALKSLFGFAGGSQAMSASGSRSISGSMVPRLRGISGDSSSSRSQKTDWHETPPETSTSTSEHTGVSGQIIIPPSQEQRSPPRTPSKAKPKPLSSSLLSSTRHTHTSLTSPHLRSLHKHSPPPDSHNSHSPGPLTQLTLLSSSPTPPTHPTPPPRAQWPNPHGVRPTRPSSAK